MNKRVCFILALALFMVSMGTLSAFAEGDSPTPSVYAENTTATAGNTFEIIVRASDLSAVGALDLYAFYDPAIFTLVSSNALSLASGTQSTINTDVLGEVSFSMISATGVSGTGSLWRMYFRVNQNAVAGVYQIKLAAGNAYNTALTPIEVSASSPRITVNSTVQEQKHLYFYSYGSSPTLYNGDTVTVRFATNNLHGLASADFELEYDETLLRFESVTLGNKLLSAQNAIYSVNSKTPGYAKLSYVATEGVTGSLSPMLSVTFTVIASKATSTQVGLKVSSIFDENLNIMTGSSAEFGLTIAEVIETPKLPEITVSEFEGAQDEFSVSVQAPGSSALAAVDLMFSFNPRQIICKDVTTTAEGCFVISNIDNENGTIKLSFICEEGISTNTEIVQISFSTNNLQGGRVTLNVSGKNAVNANYEPIAFSYESPTFICHKAGNPPTCTTPQVCTICGKEVASALGHTNAAPVVENTVDPTCIKDGSYDSVTYCSVCKAEISREAKVIAKLGHSYSTEWTTSVAPTCTATGIDERECSVCHAKETRVTAANGHTNATPVVENTVDPTCIKDGSYDSVTYCAVCKAEISREAKVIPAIGHDEIQHDGKSATCTAAGWTAYVTCSRCNYTTYKAIDALGHNEIAHNGQAPTCTDFGWKEYVTCSRCDYSTYAELSATGHSMSGWIIDEAATLEKDGRKHKECIVCGVMLEESIIPMLSHKYVSVVTSPTCTEQGYTTHTCSECKHSYVDDYIPALGHTHAPATEENRVDATCTQNGSYDSVVYCSGCSTEFSREQKIINKLGHDYGTEWTVDIAPTCTTAGSKSHHCTRCDDKTDITTVPETGHADDDKSHVCDICSFVLSTCIDANKNHECDYCGEYMGVHKAATGSNTCEYCGATITDSAPDVSDDESDKLSGGAIVAIVVSSVVVVGCGGFSLFWFVIKKRSIVDLLTIFRKK